MHKIIRQHFWIVFMVLFVGCSILPSQQVGHATATDAPTLTPVPATPTASPTESPTQTPTQTSLPLYSLDGLRMAYILDGNLYVQNSGGQPNQITNSGEDRNPIFSSDGKKIVFFHGDSLNSVYSINADGSQEQALINDSLLTIFGLGNDQQTKSTIRYLTSLAFVTGTHEMLFNTYQYDSRMQHLYVPPPYTIGLFLVDTDTGKFQKILAPGIGGVYAISPDEKLLSVAVSGHIDLFSLDGKVKLRNIITYSLAEPSEIFPRQYWLPDSSGLIVALPIEKHNDPTMPVTYTVWRYMLNSKIAVPISLTPHLTDLGGCSVSVSPDRNWIIYDTVASGFYLGNLTNSHTTLYANDACPQHFWSPDSKYFTYTMTAGNELYLSAIDEKPLSLGEVNLLGWIDVNHYIFSPAKSIPGEEKREILVGAVNGKTVLTYKSGIFIPENFSQLIFVILSHESGEYRNKSTILNRGYLQ